MDVIISVTELPTSNISDPGSLAKLRLDGYGKFINVVERLSAEDFV